MSWWNTIQESARNAMAYSRRQWQLLPTGIKDVLNPNTYLYYFRRSPRIRLTTLRLAAVNMVLFSAVNGVVYYVIAPQLGAVFDEKVYGTQEPLVSGETALSKLWLLGYQIPGTLVVTVMNAFFTNKITGAVRTHTKETPPQEEMPISFMVADNIARLSLFLTILAYTQGVALIPGLGMPASFTIECAGYGYFAMEYFYPGSHTSQLQRTHRDLGYVIGYGLPYKLVLELLASLPSALRFGASGFGFVMMTIPAAKATRNLFKKRALADGQTMPETPVLCNVLMPAVTFNDLLWKHIAKRQLSPNKLLAALPATAISTGPGQ